MSVFFTIAVLSKFVFNLRYSVLNRIAAAVNPWTSTWEVGGGTIVAPPSRLHKGGEQSADGVQRVAHPALHVGDGCYAPVEQLWGIENMDSWVTTMENQVSDQD